MNLKKLTKLLVVTALVSTATIAKVNAAPTIALECPEDHKYVKPGESVTCTVTVVPDDATVSSKSLDIGVYQDTNAYLESTFVTANTATWTSTNKIETTPLNKRYVFTTATGVTLTKTKSEVFTMTIKVKEDAANAPGTDCGQICVGTYSVDGSSYKSCFAPTIVDCTGDSCETPVNPDTGAFEDYAMVIGCAVVGLLAIAVVSKKNKFYRI